MHIPPENFRLVHLLKGNSNLTVLVWQMYLAFRSSAASLQLSAGISAALSGKLVNNIASVPIETFPSYTYVPSIGMVDGTVGDQIILDFGKNPMHRLGVSQSLSNVFCKAINCRQLRPAEVQVFATALSETSINGGRYIHPFVFSCLQHG